MINNLSIAYTYEGIDYTLSVKSDENLPFSLASAFSEVIRKSDANEEIVIEELINEFGYKQNDTDTRMVIR